MSDLIKHLKEPEIYFPGNFDTVKRANAMLSCLCQEAADALEDKDAEIIRLRQENGYKQCTIDALMLEFCPERMNREQMDEWEKHQVPVEQGDFGTSIAAMKEVIEQQAVETSEMRRKLK